MHLFTTILFIEGNPIKYEVQLSGQVFFLSPAGNANDTIDPPLLHARRQNGKWEIMGTIDEDLVAQVIEDMDLNSGRFPSLP